MRKIPARNPSALGEFGCFATAQVGSGLRSVSAWGFVGEHVGNPNFKWSPVPREAAQGRSWESGSLGEQVPVPAHPHPQGDGQIEPVGIHAPLGQGVLKPGVLSPDGRQRP